MRSVGLALLLCAGCLGAPSAGPLAGIGEAGAVARGPWETFDETFRFELTQAALPVLPPPLAGAPAFNPSLPVGPDGTNCVVFGLLGNQTYEIRGAAISLGWSARGPTAETLELVFGTIQIDGSHASPTLERHRGPSPLLAAPHWTASNESSVPKVSIQTTAPGAAVAQSVDLRIRFEFQGDAPAGYVGGCARFDG